MKQQVKSLGLILITASIFFALLLGIQFFFKNYYVADHFQEKLNKIEGIQKVDIKDDKIFISLANVSNIKMTYGEIDNVVQNENYEVVIKDFPSEILEDIALESEIALYEGAIKGNFMDMAGYIRNLSLDNGVSAKIFIDNKRIYLHMEDEDKYIYRIIQRPTKEFSAEESS